MDQVDNYENKENDTKIFYSIKEIIIVKREQQNVKFYFVYKKCN